MKRKIEWVCSSCGVEANRLTCLLKFNAEPLKPCFDVSTYHRGICHVCEKDKQVTEPRDFFYPNFSLLKRARSVKRRVIDTCLFTVCILNWVQNTSSGGGSWRRNIITRIAELESLIKKLEVEIK